VLFQSVERQHLAVEESLVMGMVREAREGKRVSEGEEARGREGERERRRERERGIG